MSTRIQEIERTVEAAHEEVHYVCCEDDVGTVALCGIDVSVLAWTPELDATCVVCIDLDAVSDHCPRHGSCRWPSVAGATHE